jgi:DNA repair ATPase RecN
MNKENNPDETTEIKEFIAKTNKLLDRVIQGLFYVRIGMESNIPELIEFKDKINAVIESLDYYTDSLSEMERKMEKTLKFFETYSKKALELADSWGMGEVFKREMDEWAKKERASEDLNSE